MSRALFWFFGRSKMDRMCKSVWRHGQERASRTLALRAYISQEYQGDPLEGTLNPTFGSLKRNLIDRVYILKGPPNPNSLPKRSSVNGNPKP